MKISKIRFKQKLKAFTIVEILITMLISVIVISITLYSYRNISYYFHKYNLNKDYLFDLEVLYSDLHLNFQDSKEIWYIDNKLIFDNLKQTNYIFGENFTIYSTLPNDTFYFKPITINAYYDNQNVLNGPIDELLINVLFLNDTIKMHFYKQYPAGKKFLIEKEISNSDLINTRF